MYKNFFGLSRNPFEISPDPFFLCLTDSHKEVLTSLYYGISSRKGFILLTGEVGTGKTLLVRCLLDLLSKQEIAFVNIFNLLPSGYDFVRYIAGDLGLKVDGQPKSALLVELNNFLVARHAKRLATVLVVDEAQNLAPEVLEEVRLLTNLETTQQKLLQILLVGQPELEQKVDSPALRPLKQRLALRCRLQALREEEVKAYISRRLTLAGLAGKPETIFHEDVIAAIQRYSQGLPRLVNTLCENCLIAAYAERSPSVSVEMVEEVAAEFRLGQLAATPESPAEPLGSAKPPGPAKHLRDLLEALIHDEDPAAPPQPVTQPTRLPWQQ